MKDRDSSFAPSPRPLVKRISFSALTMTAENTPRHHFFDVSTDISGKQDQKFATTEISDFKFWLLVNFIFIVLILFIAFFFYY